MNPVLQRRTASSETDLPVPPAGAPEPCPPPGPDPGTDNGSDADPAENNASRGGVDGLDRAGGPAEESDAHVEDGRALTTDISSSD